MLWLIIWTSLFANVFGECFDLVNDPGFLSDQWKADLYSDFWENEINLTSPYSESIYMVTNRTWWGYQPVHYLHRIIEVPNRVSDLTINLTIRTNHPELLLAEVFILPKSSETLTVPLDLNSTLDWTWYEISYPVHDDSQVEIFFKVTIPNNDQVWLGLANIQVTACHEADITLIVTKINLALTGLLVLVLAIARKITF